ncbi:MAG: PAS domain S-box protein [Gemmatimonadetes bacterium]|nr:PAS domain S-box protein [Gemmatimonadota bacterium]
MLRSWRSATRTPSSMENPTPRHAGSGGAVSPPDELLRALCSACPDAILLADREGRIRFAAGAAAKLFGYSPEELLGQPVELLVPERLRGSHQELREQYWQSPQPRPMQSGLELYARRKDGSEIPVDILLAPLESGPELLVLAIVRDLGEQRRLESALLDTAERYALVLTGMGQVVYSRRPAPGAPLSGEAEFISQQVTDLVGCPPEDFARDPGLWYALLHPEDRPVVEAATQELVNSGRPGLQEYRLRHRDTGEYRWVEDWTVPQLDDAGAVVRLFGVVRDVTVRAAAARALRESEARYRTLFEQSRSAIIVATWEGRILDFNSAALQLLGCSARDMETLAARDLFADPDDAEWIPRAILAEESVQDLEVQLQRRDGTARDCLLSATVWKADTGEVLGYEIIAHDITERKRLEREFRQAQKMEAVGRLAGGIAHDFNNLLTVIRGRADLLLAELPGEDPGRPDVDEIAQAADRAASLTQQLLAFSRKQVMQPRLLDLNAVVSNLQRMLRRLIGEDIEIATDLDPTLGKLRADPGQMEQVLMNLVVNARDAMPRGGTLSIGTRSVEVEERQARAHAGAHPGRHALLWVGDTGVGMDRDTLSRIFEPFFTTKEKAQGTGLGLSTVYGIVSQSGGWIDVQSEPGRGTRFDIYLPLAGDAAAEAPRGGPPAAEPGGGGETVLLVEDEDAVRSLARRVLERRGYTILEARTGAQALDLARQYNGAIHLLLTDIMLPQMSGHELAGQVAEVRPGLKTLYMSGYGTVDATALPVIEAGRDFVEKPFTPATLARKVREALGPE